MQMDLNELVEANVISKEIAENIQSYYNTKNSNSTNWLFVVFGILGGLLVSLGVILIIAHNWDELSRLLKTILVFIPLIIGQILCGYVLLKRPENVTWREATSAFLFFSVGATISLVSQIYNIPGDITSFLTTWMLLCLPLVYVMKSNISSLLYILGITYLGSEVGYDYRDETFSYEYWLLLLAIIPQYIYLYKNHPRSNFTGFHHCFIPLSIVIVLGTFTQNLGELMLIAYMSLFGLFLQIGELKGFKNQNLINNSYRIIGFFGTIFMLFALSFKTFWDELKSFSPTFSELKTAPEFYASILLTLVASFLLIRKFKQNNEKAISIIEWVFLLFVSIFIIGMHSTIPAVIINILALLIGLNTIKRGASKNHLGILNLGLFIITILVTCRFFDTDLNFVIRGILFITIGIGFFVANYWMIKKRKHV